MSPPVLPVSPRSSALIRPISPQLLTPVGTPPPSALPHMPDVHESRLYEARLQQLLANFDSGTHNICREERETVEERRTSFSCETRPTPPPPRRPSFLANLRPVFAMSQPNSGASSPAHSPVTSSHPHLPHSLAMTPSYSKERQIRANSMSTVPQPAEHKIQRSNTFSATPGKVAGFAKGKAKDDIIARSGEEKRHFDPSREPKLLGLL
ncbi:MAG: hypothetical protein TREMPRED_005898 [Tremellales sp. Tagirdzhanova-0007]|nr:MAG: hypothetical protein TREMPRED_005898 [Tremellales sp. Tagirdzhanova-0007]